MFALCTVLRRTESPLALDVPRVTFVCYCLSASRLLFYLSPSSYLLIHADVFNRYAQVELEDKQRKLQSKKDGIARLRQRRTAWLASLAPDTHPAAQAGQKTPPASAPRQAELKRIFSEYAHARDEPAALPAAAMSQAEINCFDALFRDAIIDAEEDPEFTQMVCFSLLLHSFYSRIVCACRVLEIRCFD
jgi:hypothetical protein